MRDAPPPIDHRLLTIDPDGGITLLARIAGLLLAAIAVQLIADSVHGFITAYQ